MGMRAWPGMRKAERSLQQHAGRDESVQSQQLVPVDKVFQKHVSRESPHMVPLLHLSNVGRRVGGRKGMLARNSQVRGDEAFLKCRAVRGSSCVHSGEGEGKEGVQLILPASVLSPAPSLVVLSSSQLPTSPLGKEVRMWKQEGFASDPEDTRLRTICHESMLFILKLDQTHRHTHSQFHKPSLTLCILLHTRG